MAQNLAVKRRAGLPKALPAHQDLDGTGRPCTLLRKISNCAALGSLTPGEGEVHLHLGLDLDRFSVQQVRLILPLLHGFDRGGSQHGVPADQLHNDQLPTSAPFSRYGLYFHCFTASIAAGASMGCPLINCRFWMLPSLLIWACRTTVP